MDICFEFTRVFYALFIWFSITSRNHYNILRGLNIFYFNLIRTSNIVFIRVSVINRNYIYWWMNICFEFARIFYALFIGFSSLVIIVTFWDCWTIASILQNSSIDCSKEIRELGGYWKIRLVKIYNSSAIIMLLLVSSAVFRLSNFICISEFCLLI